MSVSHNLLFLYIVTRVLDIRFYSRYEAQQIQTSCTLLLVREQPIEEAPQSRELTIGKRRDVGLRLRLVLVMAPLLLWLVGHIHSRAVSAKCKYLQ